MPDYRSLEELILATEAALEVGDPIRPLLILKMRQAYELGLSDSVIDRALIFSKGLHQGFATAAAAVETMGARYYTSTPAQIAATIRGLCDASGTDKA